MQQHSGTSFKSFWIALRVKGNLKIILGQHLISAMFEQLLDMDTLSWWMAENQDGKVGISYIEINTENVTQDQLDQVENECNEAIRKHIDVITHIYPSAKSEELKLAKTRGLPEDHTGPVRVIEISGMDRNMCCGTHVNNLSQLQMVKLLGTEKSKRKGNCFVNFLVGDRVSQFLSDAYRREKKMTSVLNGGPDDHCSLAEKALHNSKKYQKMTQSLLKELASLKVEELKRTKPTYFSIHRNETDLDFVNTLLNNLKDEEITLVVTSGTEAPFSLVIQSYEENITKELSMPILDMLNGKGGGKGTRFNGKFTSLAQREEVDTFVCKYFAP